MRLVSQTACLVQYAWALPLCVSTLAIVTVTAFVTVTTVMTMASVATLTAVTTVTSFSSVSTITTPTAFSSIATVASINIDLMFMRPSVNRHVHGNFGKSLKLEFECDRRSFWRWAIHTLLGSMVIVMSTTTTAVTNGNGDRDWNCRFKSTRWDLILHFMVSKVARSLTYLLVSAVATAMMVMVMFSSAMTTTTSTMNYYDIPMLSSTLALIDDQEDRRDQRQECQLIHWEVHCVADVRRVNRHTNAMSDWVSPTICLLIYRRKGWPVNRICVLCPESQLKKCFEFKLNRK